MGPIFLIFQFSRDLRDVKLNLEALENETGFHPQTLGGKARGGSDIHWKIKPDNLMKRMNHFD